MNSPNESTKQQAVFYFPIDVFAITSFISTGFYIFIYTIIIDQESFLLQSFKQRIIGLSVLEGVDVEGRTKLYLYAIILTGIIAIGLLLFLEKAMDTIIPKQKFKRERSLLTIISIFGTTNLLFWIISQKSVFIFNIYLLVALICCIITIIGVKKYVGLHDHQNLFLFDDFAFISILILAPIIPIFAILVLLGHAFVISLTIFIIYYIVFFLLLSFFVFYCPKKFPEILDNTQREIAVTCLLPLFFYPFSIPLTNEFQYWLSQWISLSPRAISIGLLLLLLLISALFYKHQILKNHQFFTTKFSLENIIFPVILAALSLYANYTTTYDIKNTIYTSWGNPPNFFELGLTSTVIQQFFDFGKIPNVSLVNPHGLSDIYSAILYSIVNGYQPLDCFLWQWITPVLMVITGYFFIKEFVGGEDSFLMMIFLPISAIIARVDIWIILFGAIVFFRFYQKPHLKNYIILSLSIILCFAWRIEAGVASLLACILISIFIYYPICKKSSLGELWKNYSKYFSVTVIILAVCVSIYVILCMMNGISPISAFHSLLNLYSIQEARGTYPGLFFTYNSQVALQYAIFPLFGLGVLIFFYWIIIKQRETFIAQFILIAFVTIGTLFISQRGTQRHSQIEEFSYYFFPLIACLLPLLWYRMEKFKSIVLFILILGAGFFIAQYPLETIHSDYTKNFFEFKTWETHETRIQIQENDIPKDVTNLIEYLNDHLHSNETYYDMTNCMMPYTFLRREYIPNSLFHMIQVGEYYQNETIKRLIQNEDRIPIVITGGYYQMDNVPNELRTYRISEYVFTHYKPIGRIDNFKIWIRDDLNVSDFNTDFSNDNEYIIPFASDNVSTYDLSYRNSNGEVVLQSGCEDPYVWNFILNDATVLPMFDSKYTGLHFEYTSDVTGPLQVYYSLNNSAFSEKNSVWGTISSGNYDRDLYIVLPVNNQYITNIRIDPPINGNIILKDAYLYPKNDFFVPDKSVSALYYNLGKLPYIWGTYDTSDPVFNQPIQEVLFKGEQEINSTTPILFSNINTTIDKTSGNYLMISLKSESEGNVTLVYGNRMEDNMTEPGIINFKTNPSREKQNYLIRISSHANWYARPVTYFELNSTIPMTIYECKILKGD
jgi:hypothetical protein